jgi:low temperature requirement protein LtrA
VHVRQVEGEERVTPLELFFDLVFVFAITQVTGFLAEHETGEGLLRGLLLLAALWWAWAAYAWLTNTLNPEEGAVRLAVFASAAAMLVVALATPTAFGADALVFGIAYFIVRALHLVLYAIAGRGDPELFAAVRRFAPGAVLGPALIIAAGFFDGPVEIGLWIAALAVDYLSALAGHGRGWRLSPAHFVERHGLIIIIALGESIVAIGVGAAGVPLDAAIITAAVLGMVVAACLWWSYFDWVIIVAEAQLTEASGAERANLARDVYSYLHMPMVFGVVLFALGMKETLAHVDEPMGIVPAIGLCGGLALYMAAHVALRLRTSGGWGHGRPLATVALLALIPVATMVPALVALALVAAVCTALIAYEAIRYRYARSWLRSHRGEFTMEEVRHVAPITGAGPSADGDASVDPRHASSEGRGT